MLFTLKITGKDLRYLLELAENKGVVDTNLKRLVRLVFQKGLLALGVKKSRAGKQRIAVQESIDPQEFERMVTREGYTMAEYLRFKKLPCSREYLRQIAQELGLKHSLEDRALEWKLVRRAREIGNPNFANREWLTERIAASVSMTRLAAEIGVDERHLYFFARAFRLTHPSFRKHGVETVTLVCAQCGTEFKRLKRWFNAALRRSPKQSKFFCSSSCVCRRIRERRRRTEELKRT